ncbi:MAG TPA: class I SAM-dependent methyltransferase [Pirellulales bacterium]
MQSEHFQLHAEIEQRHWWFVARRRILRELVRAAIAKNAAPTKTPGSANPGSESRQVLVDIGCGTGANLAAFADEYDCVGIDTSAEAIALARQRFPAMTFIRGKAPDDVGNWLATARVVLITDVLEHVAEDRGMLASIANACSLGANILITVPADMRLWSPHDEAFGHYRRYEPQSLAALWTELPVSKRLLSHFNSRLYPIVRMARSMSQKRGKAAGRSNTDFRLPARPINRALENIFAGEGRKLTATIDSGISPYHYGVSLIAILERQEAPIRHAIVEMPTSGLIAGEVAV